MTNDFLPQDYEVPVTSKYLKFESGENRFRILDRPIIGWEYWTNENKPVRLKTKPTETPKNIQIKDGRQTEVKHFWAMPVWNYKVKEVWILEITQVTIQQGIESLVKDPDWGSPFGYDIKVNKTGEGKKTTYTVNPAPKKPLDEEAQKAWQETEIKLEALYTNGDPFAKE